MAALVLLESGCSFFTYDSSRPFVDDWLPDRPERAALAELLATSKPEKRAIRKSLTETRRALATFSVVKYGEKSSYLRIGQLIEALEQFPDNPYAWIGLGAYLGISFQPSQAATSTRIGVERLQLQLRTQPDLAPVMKPVLRDGLLNLVNFSLQAQDLETAVWALDQLDEIQDLDVVHRLALTRLKLLTRLRFGDLQGAQDALATLESTEKELEENPLDFSIWYDYPRFRTPEERRETNDWLSAQILMAQSNYDDAVSTLETSLQKQDGPSFEEPKKVDLDDDELWEAHLSLATAYFRRAQETSEEQRSSDLARAREILEEVFDEIPSREFIPEEYVAFNLGNVLFAQGAYEEAIKNYRRAVRGFNRSFTDLREAWIRYIVEGDIAASEQPSSVDSGSLASIPKTIRVAARKPDLEGIVLEILASEEAGKHATWGGTEIEAGTVPQYLQLVESGLEASYVALQRTSPYHRLLLELGVKPESAGYYVYGDAFNNLANAYFELGRKTTGKARSEAWDAARRSYRIALWDNRYATPEVPHVNLARIALAEGQTPLAYRELTHALNINPLLRTALDLLLVAARNAKNSKEAAGGLYLLLDHIEQIAGPSGAQRGWSRDLVEEVETLLGDVAASEERQAVEARLQALRSHDDEALVTYREMSEAVPSNVWPWAGLVRTAAEDNVSTWLERGIELAESRHDLPPWMSVDYRYLLHQRGEQRLEKGELCSALHDFDTALKISPQWSLAEQGLELTREKLQQEGQYCP